MKLFLLSNQLKLQSLKEYLYLKQNLTLFHPLLGLSNCQTHSHAILLLYTISLFGL